MNTTNQQTDPVSREEIDAIVAGVHHDPHSVLGAHPGSAGITIRTLRPLAASVTVVLPDGRRVPMSHLHEGVFSATLPASAAEPGQVPDYRLAVSYAGAPETITDDPYRHLPTLGDMDLHLIAEGRHEELWKVLGAHVRGDGAGTSFAVWAPNARGVRVIGEFNHWDGRAHPMRSLGSSGIWELLRPRRGRGHDLQVRGLRTRRSLAGQGRSDGLPGRAAARHRLRRVRVRLRVGRRRLARRAGRAATC